jgi:hypothetical protein
VIGGAAGLGWLGTAEAELLEIEFFDEGITARTGLSSAM